MCKASDCSHPKGILSFRTSGGFPTPPPNLVNIKVCFRSAALTLTRIGFIPDDVTVNESSGRAMFIIPDPSRSTRFVPMPGTSWDEDCKTFNGKLWVDLEPEINPDQVEIPDTVPAEWVSQ